MNEWIKKTEKKRNKERRTDRQTESKYDRKVRREEGREEKKEKEGWRNRAHTGKDRKEKMIQLGRNSGRGIITEK